MQLIYKEEQMELLEDNSVFTMIFKKVNEIIEDKDVIFSHLTIDGIDVFENHESYIYERMNEIMRIEIVTRTTKEMIWETMGSIHEYIERAIPALKELVDESYGDFGDKSWEGLNQLSEGMQWMLQFKEFTKASPEQPANWEEVEKSFEACEEHFTQLLEAVETEDTVLISDILAYEISPAYESLFDSIANSLKDKEFLKYVN